MSKVSKNRSFDHSRSQSGKGGQRRSGPSAARRGHDHGYGRDRGRTARRDDHAPRRSRTGFAMSDKERNAHQSQWSEEEMPEEFSAAEIVHDEDRDDLTFAELGVPAPLAKVLADDGKTTAFPIQADTLPDSLSGRDVLGRGRTGSGKTLAYAIPMVARLGEGEKGGRGEAAMREVRRLKGRGARDGASLPAPRGMVLVPTRELAEQVDEVIAPLASAYGILTATIYGGVSQRRQEIALNKGADIIVACPGRLEDLLGQGILTLSDVQVTVLDEADLMADMGFLPAVTRILEQTPADGQRMLFSATLDHGVDAVVKQFLTDPRVHAVADGDGTVSTMTQHLFAVSQGNKYEVIRQLASGQGKRILFTRTKFQAQKMAKKLVAQGIPAVDLQGNLNQNQRSRHLAAFADGQVRVLVATDVAARGIDISDVELVVQTEPPKDPKSFQHRSGRTARAGKSGDVVTLVLPDQKKLAARMMRRAGIEVEPVEVTPGDATLTELVGEPAPLVMGWALPDPKKLEAEKRRKEKEERAAAREAARKAGSGKARAGRRGRDRGAREDFDELSFDEFDDFSGDGFEEDRAPRRGRGAGRGARVYKGGKGRGRAGYEGRRDGYGSDRSDHRSGERGRGFDDRGGKGARRSGSDGRSGASSRRFDRRGREGGDDWRGSAPRHAASNDHRGDQRSGRSERRGKSDFSRSGRSSGRSGRSFGRGRR